MDQIISVYWIKILATLVVFGALITLFVRQGREKENESEGEGIRALLDQLGEEYQVLDDVSFKSKYGMRRADHIVVSPYGVFVITAVRVSGQLMGGPADEEWFLKSGFKKDLISNPLWQNRKYCNALESLLGEVRLMPVVVLVNARMKGPREPYVVRLKQLQSFILKQKTVRFSDEEMKEVIKKLKNV